jgi:hypothetical protein
MKDRTDFDENLERIMRLLKQIAVSHTERRTKEAGSTTIQDVDSWNLQAKLGLAPGPPPALRGKKNTCVCACTLLPIQIVMICTPLCSMDLDTFRTFAHILFIFQYL